MATYNASFAVGQRISIRSRLELEEFKRSWSFHNPLVDEQLSYADKEATVSKIGYYHGGDVLYTLSDVPGIWHEQCLRATD